MDTQSRGGIEKEIEAQLKMIKEDRFTYKQDVLRQYKELYYLHLKHNSALYSQNNDVKIFTDGTKKFSALIKDLESAKDHIHLLYYIIRHDQLGTKIADTLIKKAKEGIEVRVLYDDMGSRSLSIQFIRRVTDVGIQVDAFFPPLIPKINFKINFRNHRKLAIIDGKVGYIGGFNIGDEYLGKVERFGYWRDTHLRIRGTAVRSMQKRFILDWNQASRNDLKYDERFYKEVSKRSEERRVG